MSSSLSQVEEKLPAGFRFHPRDDELICDYLMKWVMPTRGGAATGHGQPLLIEVDLNKCEPWDIPAKACVGGKDWYFYSQRDRKYATGLRTNRSTVSGYWKATGKDKAIFQKGTLVGMRKTLVFYEGRAPKGKKSSWVMHEFRLHGPSVSRRLMASAVIDWVVCRVFNKNKSAKQETGSNYECDDNYHKTNSLSLPPLMDPNYRVFDQSEDTRNNNNNNYEQVSCFSIFTPNPNFHMHQDLYPRFQDDHDLIGVHLSNPAYGKKAVDDMTDVWRQVSMISDTRNLNTKDDYSPSYGEQRSESYLSELGLQQASMWNHFY